MKFDAALFACVLATSLFAASTLSAKSTDKLASYKCAYSGNKIKEWTDFDACTWSDRHGRLHLKQRHLRSLIYDRFGLSEIVIEGTPPIHHGFWYAKRNGQLAPVMMLDNGADPFNDGLARSPSGKKIGYIDRRFRLVVPAIYDGAHPFENGRAVVCVGCVERHNVGMEASYYEGGSWGCIDVHGREVIPLEAMKNGNALFARHCRN
jgi:WG containing repeat